MRSALGRWTCLGLSLLGLTMVAGPAAGGERTEHFDRDPGWEGHNNRASTPPPRQIRQDFGFSPTNHAGRAPGELGGFLNPAAEPAYHARPIPEQTFANSLSASGSLACTGRQFHALLGFFQAQSLGAWRTPNTIALRLYGRGDVFYAYVEYCTSRCRAGGDSPRGFTIRDPQTGRDVPRPFPSRGARHTWSLHYDPAGHDGGGSITATIDDVVAVCHVDAGHKADGATFDRFGLMNVMKQADDGGELWVDDVVVNGQSESFDRDPKWEERGNRVTFRTTNVRPRFDFGFSPTHYAGHESGEMGGLVFRGDGRYESRIAYYADRLEALSLDRPLRAQGRICLRRGVSDSTTLLGFFHAQDSTPVERTPGSGLPPSFVGLAIEGPSREGFQVYPVYRLRSGAEDFSRGNPPHILPDGQTHDWSMRYTPSSAGTPARLSVALDKAEVSIPVHTESAAAPTSLNRFGLITTRIDGNSQLVYFDDLTYTCSKE